MRSAVAILLLALLSCASTRQPERGKYAYLPVVHERQSPDLCLPTCVAMTLNYYGGSESQWTIKRLSNEHKDIFSTTTLLEAQRAVRGLGYVWDRWRWPADSEGFLHAIRAVEASLDDGKPVIVSILYRELPQQYRARGFRGARWRSHVVPVGHALLAYGYDAKAEELYLLDPARAFPGKRHIGYDELRTLWNNGSYFQALFTAPLGAVPTGHRIQAKIKLSAPHGAVTPTARTVSLYNQAFHFNS